MTPDIGFYIDRFDLSTFAHTLPGSFLACLPTGMILLILYYLFCRPVCYSLPSPHRQALLPLCPDFPSGLTRWGIILLSLLLGAWTHNFWDSFTHEHGWFVDRIPCVATAGYASRLDYGLHVSASAGTQHVVGFTIVALAYWLWLRRQEVNSSVAPGSDRWRYLFWFGILVLSLRYLASRPRPPTRSRLRSPMFPSFAPFSFAQPSSSSAIAVPLCLVATSVIYALSRPSDFPKSDPTS